MLPHEMLLLAFVASHTISISMSGSACRQGDVRISSHIRVKYTLLDLVPVRNRSCTFSLEWSWYVSGNPLKLQFCLLYVSSSGVEKSMSPLIRGVHSTDDEFDADKFNNKMDSLAKSKRHIENSFIISLDKVIH